MKKQLEPFGFNDPAGFGASAKGTLSVEAWFGAGGEAGGCCCGGRCGCGGTCGGSVGSGAGAGPSWSAGELWADGGRWMDGTRSWPNAGEEWRADVGGGGGEDPMMAWIDGSYTVEENPKRVCGPDVTDYFASRLTRIMDRRSSRGWILAGAMCGQRGSVDFKDAGKPDYKPRLESGNCPKNCGWSVMMCGECISNQVPGNIALGAAVGQLRAAAIGYITNDSGDDLTAYAIGSGLYDERLREDSDGGHASGDAPEASSNLKKQLCEKLNRVLVDKKADRDDLGIERVPCAPCPDSAKRKPPELTPPNEPPYPGAPTEAMPWSPGVLPPEEEARLWSEYMSEVERWASIMMEPGYVRWNW